MAGDAGGRGRRARSRRRPRRRRGGRTRGARGAGRRGRGARCATRSPARRPGGRAPPAPARRAYASSGQIGHLEVQARRDGGLPRAELRTATTVGGAGGRGAGSRRPRAACRRGPRPGSRTRSARRSRSATSPARTATARRAATRWNATERSMLGAMYGAARVELARGRPAERVERGSTTGTRRPTGRRRSSAGRSGTSWLELGLAGRAVLPVVDPVRRDRSSKFVPEPVHAARRPPRRGARRSTAATPGSGASGIVGHVVLEPADVADRPHHRVEDRLAVLRHRHADRLRPLRLAQRRRPRCRRASKSATPRKWPTSVTGRSNRECAPAARSAIAAM